MLRMVVAGACALALTLGVACGSDGDDADETPSAARTAAASATAGTPAPGGTTEPLLTPGPDDWPEMNPNINDTVPFEEALTFGEPAWKVPLAPVETDGSFELSLPSSWLPNQAEGQTFLSYGYRDPELNRLFAGLSAECVQGVTFEELVVADRDYIFGVQIAYRVFAPRPAEIGGRLWQEVRWSGGLTGLISDNNTFYFEAPDCIWRFQFGTYHGLRIKDYRQEIEAILTSFETAP